MNAVEAMLIIARAKQKEGEDYSVEFSFIKKSGLKFHSITKNAAGQPLFVKVNKQEFIAWLERAADLHKKRSNLRNVLRSSPRKS